MAKNATGYALSALNTFAGSNLPDRFRVRELVEKIVYRGTKTGFQSIGVASRQFRTVQKKIKATRLSTGQAESGLFNLNVDDEQQMIQETVHRFATDVIRPAAADANEKAETSSELVERARELGLIYYAIPETFGGAQTQQSTVTNMLITEALSYGDMGIAIALQSSIGVANAITRWGSGRQQETYLPAFMDETSPLRATIAVNEPSALFNPTKLQTKAYKQGNEYILNGVKTIVPIASSAEIFLIAAHVEGYGPQIFIVESAAKGLVVENDQGMGVRAATLGKITLKNVKVDASQLLGERAGDFDYSTFVAYSHLAWCAAAVGNCQAILDYVIPYCNERKAFGEPISHRQSVAFMIANIGIELESMRVLIQRAASRAERGLPFQREAYLAKLLCSEKAMEIGTNGVQLLGGHGFTKEYPVERWYRDLRLIGIADGGLHL